MSMRSSRAFTSTCSRTMSGSTTSSTRSLARAALVKKPRFSLSCGIGSALTLETLAGNRPGFGRTDEARIFGQGAGLVPRRMG